MDGAGGSPPLHLSSHVPSFSSQLEYPSFSFLHSLGVYPALALWKIAQEVQDLL